MEPRIKVEDQPQTFETRGVSPLQVCIISAISFLDFSGSKFKQDKFAYPSGFFCPIPSTC